MSILSIFLTFIMSSTTDPDNNKISLNLKYHIPLIYSIDELGNYYGSYYCKPVEGTGFFQAKTFEEMYDEAYDSLTTCVYGENNIPFDVDNIKNSVVFDVIKCDTGEEMDMAHDMRRKGKSSSEIIEALKE